MAAPGHVGRVRLCLGRTTGTVWFAPHTEIVESDPATYTSPPHCSSPHVTAFHRTPRMLFRALLQLMPSAAPHGASRVCCPLPQPHVVTLRHTSPCPVRHTLPRNATFRNASPSPALSHDLPSSHPARGTLASQKRAFRLAKKKGALNQKQPFAG